MDATGFTYPSPLTGYENAPPLPHEKAEDGKSFQNKQTGVLSKTYEKFPTPLDNSRRGGFDVHVYHYQDNAAQTEYARALWQRIRHEFPELRIYTFWDKPLGPHPIAMFEVNLLSPAQFGAFIPWLAIWRGPLSVLVHPNTTTADGGVDENGVKFDGESELRDHTQRAIWMGERVPLDVGRIWGAKVKAQTQTQT